ncbi:hypothetical protein CBL_07613 [Carabus blaptoides fortunei]
MKDIDTLGFLISQTERERAGELFHKRVKQTRSPEPVAANPEAIWFTSCTWRQKGRVGLRYRGTCRAQSRRCVRSIPELLNSFFTTVPIPPSYVYWWLTKPLVRAETELVNQPALRRRRSWSISM